MRNSISRAGQKQEQRGQTILLVALSLVFILAMAALAIDVVTLYTARSEAQRTADAAALAGAKMLVDSGMTSDPCNTTLAGNAKIWATQQATTTAQQNKIAGVAPGVPNVTFPNGASTGCPGNFGINPQIMVQVQRTDVPTFFARIWSRTLATISATAVAEAYNPSNGASAGSPVPIALRCVKPLLLPNCDPWHTMVGGSICSGNDPFVNTTTGMIINAGQSPAGVVGEFFTMKSNCGPGAQGTPCVPGTPAAGQYYPLALPPSALHLCPGVSALCQSPPAGFQQDLQCCSGSTLQCGQQYSIDTTAVKPDTGVGGEAQLGGQCLIHEPAGTPFSGCSTNNPQDCLFPFASPPQIVAGTNNPFLSATVTAGTPITTSDSVVTVPLYDNGSPGIPAGPLTVVGFLQLFINDVRDDGTITATIMNVAGCDQNVAGNPVQGAATTIPVRLIHQ